MGLNLMIPPLLPIKFTSFTTDLTQFSHFFLAGNLCKFTTKLSDEFT